jgi:hypothetical protein
MPVAASLDHRWQTGSSRPRKERMTTKLITDLLETERQRQDIARSILHAIEPVAGTERYAPLYEIATLIGLEDSPEGGAFLLLEAQALGLEIAGQT